jgi:hypothetical protein
MEPPEISLQPVNEPGMESDVSSFAVKYSLGCNSNNDFLLIQAKLTDTKID